MSAKAFYKSTSIPQLVHRLEVFNRVVEAWTTTCIVTNFGKTSPVKCSVLVNPCNPELSGVNNFPYFPRGGPVPKEKPMSMHKDWQPLGYVSQWGGMEVGDGMMFPVSVVDGLVHQLGGLKLEAECAWKRMKSINGQACPVGEAVKTSAGSDTLANEYDAIVHTAPPFFKHHEHPEIYLKKCYENSLRLAFQAKEGVRVASPLLGAGARGFPEQVAIQVAACSVNTWLTVPHHNDECQQEVIAFGFLERQLADSLFDLIETSQ